MLSMRGRHDSVLVARHERRRTLRNQGLFSLKSAVSAMHPGYMLLKDMPVLLWYLLCNSDTVIMLQTFASL
jgi:hypothetical protein